MQRDDLLHRRRSCTIALVDGFVAVTDPGWYERLSRDPGPRDANFWRPSARRFKLAVGTPFLFKLKAPHNAVAGFGFFAGFSILPDWLAWETFGEANGVDDLDALRARLRRIQEGARIEADAGGRIGFHAELVINPKAGTDALTDPTQLDRIEVKPPFEFTKNPKNDQTEFERQLKMQESAMNAMDVAKWQANRNNYKGGDDDAGRSAEGTKEQAKVLLAEINAFRRRVLAERKAAYVKAGKSSVDAETQANEFVNRLLERVTTATNRSKFLRPYETDADGTRVKNEVFRVDALHALDQVAGGDPKDPRGVGGRSENRSIGRQWAAKGRIDGIETQVNAQIKTFQLKPEDLAKVKMNVALFPITTG